MSEHHCCWWKTSRRVGRRWFCKALSKLSFSGIPLRVMKLSSGFPYWRTSVFGCCKMTAHCLMFVCLGSIYFVYFFQGRYAFVDDSNFVAWSPDARSCTTTTCLNEGIGPNKSAAIRFPSFFLVLDVV